VKLDKNGDGFLVLDEFKYVFEEIAQKTKVETYVKEGDVQALFKALDINNSGKIDYSEFLSIFVLNGIYQYESYLKDIFKKLDTNKDGKVTKKELEEFFKSETPFIFNQDIAECMNEIDLNKDGVIDQAELIAHMRTKRSQSIKSMM